MEALVKNVLQDIEKSFDLYPLVKYYVIQQIREQAMHEALIFNNIKALMGNLNHIHVLDLVTYIGAPLQAKKVIGLLIRKYGDNLCERAMKEWVKLHFEELCEMKNSGS